MTLLLIEDEERVASFLTIGLQAQGYQVEHASSGGEALASLRTRTPDLIVLDLSLPDMDGLDVLRRLREAGNSVPVVILTARADVEDIVAGLNRGADDYITKPFAFDELLARVHARLRAARAGD